MTTCVITAPTEVWSSRDHVFSLLAKFWRHYLHSGIEASYWRWYEYCRNTVHFSRANPGVGHPKDAPRRGAGGETMLDNPAERLWHRVVFPQEFDADYEERIIAEARSIAHRRMNERRTVRDPLEAKELFKLRLLGNPEEMLACLFLDNRHRVIAFEILFRGSVDGCVVHSRVVARHALLHNAAAVIVAHNHPSGVCEPSESDRRITQQMREALNLIEVRLLDHFITGLDQVTSMAERGLM